MTHLVVVGTVPVEAGSTAAEGRVQGHSPGEGAAQGSPVGEDPEEEAGHRGHRAGSNPVEVVAAAAAAAAGEDTEGQLMVVAAGCSHLVAGV